MKVFKIVGAVVLSLSLSTGALAQVSMGGAPYQWGEVGAAKALQPSVKLGLPNKSDVQAIAEDQEPSDMVFQYGIQRFHSADVLAEGVWSVKDNGGRICRFSIVSPGAAMLSAQFSSFDLEPGAILFVYNKARTEFLGGFTEASEKPAGDFATAVVQGEELIIEYHEPVHRRKGSRSVVLESITHGVIDIFELNRSKQGIGQEKDYWPGYPSDTCHNNMACSIANGWETVGSSVAMFLRPDGAGCTGVLINNTANDGTPYFYLANHCYVPTESQWVFYFNYDAPACIGDTGQTQETVVGATLVAREHFADFVLVELTTAPQTVYNVHYAGWNRDTVNTPTLGVSIMHPAFDVKKFTIDYGPVLGSSLGNSIGPSVPVWATSWDSGIVESGASGGPIFNQDKRIVGNIGNAWGFTCATAVNGSGVVASKFGYQWDNGPIPSQRLKEWLDPQNTGAMFIDGFPNTQPAPITVPLTLFLEGSYDAQTGLMNDALRDSGFVPLNEPYTGLGFTHYGDGGSEVTTAPVLATTGNSAVVDWVMVELRNKLDSTQILASHSALVLRDGTVVGSDGTSTLEFTLPADDYYIAIRHRNHLAMMTGNPIALSTSTATINLSDGSVPTYGGATAMSLVNGVFVLTHADVNADLFIKYAGQNNDRDPILILIGGSDPTISVNGYHVEDINMDGVVKYVGTDNDRDIILDAVGGSVPTAIRTGKLP